MPRTFGQHYILVDGEPQPVTFEEFMAWYFSHWQEARIAYTLIGEVLVSTIFLGLGHNLRDADAAPILFETMVFGGPLDHKIYRTRTRADALCEHERVCSLVQNFQA